MNAHMIKHVTANFHLGHFMLLLTACEIESNSAVVSVVMRSCEIQKINLFEGSIPFVEKQCNSSFIFSGSVK